MKIISLILVSLYVTLTMGNANTDKTVSWANSNCAVGTHEEWLCAEYVARALMAGGEFADCTTAQIANCKGYNLRMAYGLRDALIARGWKSQGGTKCTNIRGGVQIWTSREHAALTLGSGKLDQHNPNHCSTNCDWETYNVYTNPKWALADAAYEEFLV